MTQKMRLTRALVDLIPAAIADPGVGGVEAKFEAEDYHERAADEILANLPADGHLWVFAFGSLIWKPRFDHVEKRRAKISGWRRAFCLGPDTRRRGNPEAPGLMLSLDEGDGCEGIAFRLPNGNLREDLLHLLHNEPPIMPEWVTAQTPEGAVRCIAHVCPRESLAYVGGLSSDEIADRLYCAVGMWGSMADYVFNTVVHLAKSGIHDAHLWEIQDKVAERLERLRPR